LAAGTVATTVVSISATTAPMARTSPSLALKVTFPATPDWTSVLILSVSSSNNGVLSVTTAPSATSQRDRVPSVIDSPTAGILTAWAMGTVSVG
jgi:hypothetical protein